MAWVDLQRRAGLSPARPYLRLVSMTETPVAAPPATARSVLSSALDKKAAGLAFVIGLAAILTALGSQYLGGLQPCELCLEQRMAYYWGLPVLAAVLVLWNRIPIQ